METSNILEQTSSSTQETMTLSTELSEIANKLDGIVKQFKRHK
jgi:methyl-accepting chemotaxis protein